ncbi:MAG TPA: signal peptide peptidase SppA [candidate division Zixibacteria bacterium]|nr:signal peptide peptidase SppA [candidate division Zixibacteria bacterium]
MKRYFIFALVALMVGGALAQGVLWGTAAVDDPMGMHKNPGYLGLGHGAESAVFGSFSTDSFSTMDIENTHGILLNLQGLAGGYENIGGMKRWTTGMGFGDRTFGIGYLRTWTSHDSWGGGWRNGWILGAIVRPWDFVSGGWSYESSPAMEGHRVGIALRPRTWRVTVFGDVLKEDRADWADIGWGAGGELHLVDGVRVFGRYDYFGKDDLGETVDQISAGLRIDNPFAGTGAIATTGIDGEWSEFSLYSVASSKKLPSLFKLPKTSLSLDLSGDYAERPQAGLFSPRKRAFGRLLRSIERAAEDDRVEALVIRYRFPNLNFAQTEELRDVLQKFKANGKPILLYADNLGNLSYYLASVADFIAIPPSGSGVGIIGLGAEMMFFRGALDKIGVEPDFVNIGEYKSAMEMFTQTGPSDYLSENMNEILDSYEAEFLGRIAEGRGISIEQARELVDNGPYTDIESDSLGLIDSLMYWDQFEEYVRKERKLKTQSFGAYALQQSREMNWGEPDRIAVIVVEGNIVKGSGGAGGLFGGASVGEREIISAVNSAKNNKSVKGIMLRINSGGGSALASDLMAHALSDAAEKKPLVVSMAGSAASGGYLVAMPGAKIFSDRITITGSIGVISGKIALGGLYDKLGITTARFERGENSAIYSSAEKFTPSQRERIHSGSLRIYDVFKDWVADGREIPVDSVDVLGRGRIYTGEQALEIGLVDTLGGFLDALDYLIEETGANRRDLALWFMPGLKASIESMLDMMAMQIPVLRELKSLPVYPFEDGEALYLMPFAIEVK